MFYRIAILSLALFFLTAANVDAGDFPRTAQDYASLYEMHLYKQFQGNSAEYRRRIDVSKKVIRDFKKAGKNANEQQVIDWYRTASHSGVAPTVPVFGSQAPASEYQSSEPQQSNSFATPAEEPVAPEYDWGQSSDPAEAAEETPETAPEPDFEEMASDAEASEPWSAEDLDNAYGDPAETSSSSESLVTSDPAAASVLKKSNQLPTTQPADPLEEEPTEEMPDLSEVWGDSTSNESEAAESTDMLAAADSLKDAATSAAEATGFGDLSSSSGDWTSNLPTAPGGNVAAPAMGVGFPLALAGVGLINGVISLICMIKQLVAAFKNSALLGIISLVFCGIGGLIIGWIKHKEWGLTKTMKVWTACTVIGILIQVGAGFMAATMGG